MRGKRYTAKEKDAAKSLIIAGKSYSFITHALGVPKSTLSVWFGKTLKKPMSRKAMLEHLASIRPSANKALRRKFKIAREDRDSRASEAAQKTFVQLPCDNIHVLKAMLALLYWAEGSKRDSSVGTKFANTDPDLMELYVTLLRQCYAINESKLKVSLHMHYYHRVTDIKKFWSDRLHIPLDQFNKVYFKKRSKTKRFRKNFAGICFLYYGDTALRKELLQLNSLLKKGIVGS